MNMKRRKHRWVWLIVAAYIYLIFRNSMMIADVSEDMSMSVTYRILNLLERVGLYWADPWVFNGFIRKCAHFAEFAGLGFLVGLAMHISPLFKSRFLNFVLFLLTIPVSDEVIQYYTEGRSMQVSDMFLDGCGVIFGGFVSYVLILIIRDLFFRPKP